MRPFLFDGDTVHITPVNYPELRIGDLIFAKVGDDYVLHRLVHLDLESFTLAGDAFVAQDIDLEPAAALGRVIHCERRGRSLRIAHSSALIWYRLRPLRQVWRRVTRTR